MVDQAGTRGTRQEAGLQVLTHAHIKSAWPAWHDHTFDDAPLLGGRAGHLRHFWHQTGHG